MAEADLSVRRDLASGGEETLRRLSKQKPFDGRRLWAYAFVLPALLALLAAFGYPLIEVIRFSFYSGAVGDLTYVGTANYEGLWEDPVFVGSLFNNLKLLATVP